MGGGKFFIIYPCGDKSRLCLLRLENHREYELRDYSVASKKDFTERDDAITYAIELANKHNLRYEGDEDGYLD